MKHKKKMNMYLIRELRVIEANTTSYEENMPNCNEQQVDSDVI